VREEARLWWEQAKHDLETANVLLENERLDAASFYCQQAVEKALKAFCLHVKKESPPATHSLTRLAQDCDLPPEFKASLRNLTAEYVVSRYPDASGDIPFLIYDSEQVAETLAEARRIIAWVEPQLSE
jgi:HEPN domain-containing protein